jgi:predicted Zn-dependent protease
MSTSILTMKPRSRRAPTLSRLAFGLCLLSALPAGPALAQVNLPVLGNTLSGTISQQQEHDFGREFLRQVRRQSSLLDDPLLAEYIASLTYKLAVNSELTDHRLEFVLIDNTQLNAFAAPGGIIGVNAGLLLHTQNEGQLASILAHELAHISQRHYARSVAEQRANAIPNMAGLLASLVILATAGGEAGQAALMTNQALGVENQLRFSRSNEQEADSIGIRTLYNSGFDPYDMAGMFEQLMRTRGSAQRIPEFMLTHPLDESRVANSKNRANTYPAVRHSSSSEFLLMRERVQMHYASNVDAEIASREQALPRLSGAEAAAARYGIALGQLKRGQHVQATQTLETLLAQEPERITYAVLAAEIALAAKDYSKAREILEHHLRINPDNHPLTMTYATVLTRSGDHARAATVLEKHSTLYPNDLQLWYELAEIQGLAGNIAKVHLARAEYFICVGDFARAREQLNFAQDQENDRLVQARIRQRLDYIRDIQEKFYR